MLFECIYCDKIKGIWAILRYTQHPSTSFQRTCFPESPRNCPSGIVASEKCITGCWDPFKCWILSPCCSLCLQRGLYTQHAKGRTPPYVLPFTARTCVIVFPLSWKDPRHLCGDSCYSGSVVSVLTSPSLVRSHIQSSALPSSISCSITIPPLVLFLSLSSNDAQCDMARAGRQRCWIWTELCTYYIKNLVFVTFHNKMHL